MTPKTVTKTILVTAANLGTTYAVSAALQKATKRFVPDITLWTDDTTRKEIVIQTTKVVGIALGIACVATVAAAAVSQTIDQNLWNDDNEEQLIEN